MAETKNPQLILETAVDGTGVKPGLNDVKVAARDAFADVGKSAQEAGKQIDAIGTRGSGAAQGIERAAGSMTESVKRISTAANRAISENQRALAARDAGSTTATVDVRATPEFVTAFAQRKGVDVSAIQQQMDILRSLNAELSVLEAKERELSTVSVFEKKAADAAKLLQATEYVRVWEAELQKADAAQAALASDQTFSKQHAAAAQLVRDSEYVRFWEESLRKADAAQNEMSAQQLFEAQHASAARLVKDAEYVRFWEDAINKAEVAEKRLASQNGFVENLRKQTDAIGKTRSELLEMQAAELGVADKAAPLIARMRESEARLAKVGLTARETSYMLRLVPAQFTDIAVSLAAGQNPMMVMLQQGGQLKDMFGGVGAAAKALGGYMLSLINPLTMAAAVATALGVAFFQGSKESQELAKSIILTGNAAGTTAGALQDIARGVAEATGATRGAVAEALGQVVTTGKVAAANVGLVAEAAVRMERATGQSIKETVKQFEELGRSPVEASIKLNEQAHFLTAEIFRQIKALEDQGRATDAAALAQKAWADALNDRTGEVVQNLGWIERALKNVWDTAKGTWDAVADVGRPKSVGDQLKDVADEIAAHNPFSVFGPSLEELKTKQANLQELARLEKQAATRTAEIARRNQAGIDWEKDGDKFLSRRAQMEREIAKAKELGALAGKSSAEIAQRELDIRKKYEEKTRPKSNNDLAQAYAAQLSAEKEFTKAEVTLIQERVKQRALTEEQGIDQILAIQERGYLKQVALLQDQIAKTKDPGDKDKLRGQITEAGLGMVGAVEKGRTERVKLADDQLKTQQAYVASIGEETNALLLQAKAEEEENARIGMTERQIAQLTAARYDALIARKEEEAAAKRGAEGQESEVFLLEQQISALERMKASTLKRPKLTEQAAEFQEWISLADRGAREIQDIFAENLFNGFSDGLDGMLKDFGIVIQKMIAQAVAADLARRIIGAMGGEGTDWKSAFMAFAGMFSGGSTSTASTGGTFNGLSMPARAEGGPVSAGHTYLVGEKGPEILTMGGNGFVTPNNKLGGMGEVKVFMNISTPDARSFTASSGQVAVAAQRAISRARRNM